MTTRTGVATHGVCTTTPAGEVHLVATNAMNRHLYLTPDKAESLARALLGRGTDRTIRATRKATPQRAGLHRGPPRTRPLFSTSPATFSTSTAET